MDWISVEERLPETWSAVLTLQEGQRYNVGNCGQGVWWLQDQSPGTAQALDITHWMPLPAPPEDKGPFFVGESSCWPHPEGVCHGLRHKTAGWIFDFSYTEARTIRDRLNDIWQSDKGSNDG